MPKIPTYDAGNLSIRPSETGVEAEAGTARRVGMFYNQAGSAEDTLARETERLAGQTQQLGRETSELGSEKGADLSQIGRAIGGGIESAGDAAIKYLDNQEISKGSADFTSLMLRATQEWNSRVKNADPNDPTVGPKFLADLNGELQQFKDNGGFITENGQKFAEAHIDALRQHMAEKTIGDMSALAGEAAVVNHQQTINQLSATVHGDPSSIDFALATLKSSTEGTIASNPNMTGAKANEVRMELQQKGAESIVKAAAIGYIDKTGKMPDWVTDPKYAPYVNATELQTFQRQAQAQAKQNAVADRQLELQKRQLAEQNVRAASSKVMSDNVTFDPQTGKPIIDPKFFTQSLDIVKNNPDAPNAAETFRAMSSWGESQQAKGEKPVDDPVVKSDLMSRMFSADNPTTSVDLWKARAAGKISDPTFQAYHGLVQELEQSPLKGPVWENTISAVKGELILSNVGLPGKDIPGEANFSKWAQTFIPQYLAKSRDGSLPPNALDVKDPNSMISQSMAPFKRTVAQRAQDYLATLGGVNPSSAGAPSGPAERNDAMPAIPPPNQRPPGSIYETPRGKMKWTGTGWVAP